MALIYNLNWPTVSDIIRSETATSMYKPLSGLVPKHLSNLFLTNSTQNVRELRNTETDISLPLRQTKNGQRTYPSVDLSVGINSNFDRKQAPSLATFKKRFKIDTYALFLITIIM